jgi:hypothetical protein
VLRPGCAGAGQRLGGGRQARPRLRQQGLARGLGSTLRVVWKKRTQSISPSSDLIWLESACWEMPAREKLCSSATKTK